MNALQTYIANLEHAPYLKSSDMPELIRLARLFQCLVRCGGCRFICAAQDVPHLIRCVEAGGDYVRDVSFYGEYPTLAAQWQPERMPETIRRAYVARAEQPRPATKTVRLSDHTMFNEGDCGGVWDGFQVTSDADSGL